jgi:hypothetical protein
MFRILTYLLRAACVFILSLGGVVLTLGQSSGLRADIPAGVASNQRGPTFIVNQSDLHLPVTVIAYGDVRFTDPSDVFDTNPTVRQALVARIAQEKPDAVLLNGDVPFQGRDKNDYSVFRAETTPWRDAHLRIYPALGNHEFAGCTPQQCLENWWAAFPELQNRRWYSVRLGNNLYAIALDSDASLLPNSEQRLWLEAQIASLPKEILFVLIVMHHPPVADIQTKMFADHNPRPNEIALADYLKKAAVTSRARFLVSAGHIHNYERFVRDDVVYLVSGGGGAAPYPVERTPGDFYQDASFPNFHYVKLELDGDKLNGAMVRLADPHAPQWEIKDTFSIRAK